MRIADSAPVVTPSDELFPSLHLDNFIPGELCFAIMLALAKNRFRQRTFCPTKLAQIMRELHGRLRKDPLLDELAACYQRQPHRCPLLLRAELSFWAAVLGLTVKDLLQFLVQPDGLPLLHAFGQEQPCSEAAMFTFHSRIGEQRKARLYARGKDVLAELLEFSTLTEDDLLQAVATFTFDQRFLTCAKTYGFGFLLTYLSWQGVLADLEACLSEPRKANAYPLREMLVAYFQRTDSGIVTREALADELKNQLAGLGDTAMTVIAPTSPTFLTLLEQFDVEKLILLDKKHARRALRPHLRLKGRRYQALVAIDATLLALFGQFEGQSKYWDHVAKRAIWGYKLYIIFAVDSRQPLGFYLREKENETTPQGEATFLEKLVQEARELLGVDRLGYVLFDKGFWSQAEFAALVEDGEKIVTPAILYDSFKTVIKNIPRAEWLRILTNERLWEGTYRFGNGLVLRLIVWKKLGKVAVKGKNGRPKLDKRRRMKTKWAPVYYSYLTNLSADELDADQVVALYGQRWGVEDFIEQMANQYHLGHFPDTTMKIVKVHIALTFLLYRWVRGFAQLAAEWLAQPKYGRMEVCRFGRCFLRRPLSVLEQTRAQSPKTSRPRRPHDHVVFAKSLVAMGP